MKYDMVEHRIAGSAELMSNLIKVIGWHACATRLESIYSKIVGYNSSTSAFKVGIGWCRMGEGKVAIHTMRSSIRERYQEIFMGKYDPNDTCTAWEGERSRHSSGPNYKAQPLPVSHSVSLHLSFDRPHSLVLL